MRRSNLWLILTVLDTSPHRDPEEGVSSSVSWLSSATLLGCGNESETIVQSAVKGVNTHLEEFSAIGGAMAHFIDNCLYGYSFGVLRSGIAAADAFCGISRAVCERAGSPGSEQ